MDDPIHGPNVLVVEDSVDDMLLTRRALKKAGIRVPIRTCENGEDAIRCLSGLPRASLVLLDWKLPRRSGAEVLAWMRGNPALGITPVIVVSSSRLPEDMDAALAGGAHAFLEKPVQPPELIEQLERLGLSSLCSGANP